MKTSNVVLMHKPHQTDGTFCCLHQLVKVPLLTLQTLTCPSDQVDEVPELAKLLQSMLYIIVLLRNTNLIVIPAGHFPKYTLPPAGKHYVEMFMTAPFLIHSRVNYATMKPLRVVKVY